ncbi:MAE_28990/MAE_18760 family HEPN-like nuclease [Stakelama saccharophila]|uniref:MAE_28990/MAE_18760 family HEPN-like nuclease n=1 Tax=Stakelama saccharophila TaxID=3075605 RepID=A0ABZ0BCD2_9SPHN|nr:MAE_28990/MAE_18760 family HEPN-like nuclease [Stakelama sp. W311]WNO54948.1 MAE_28990/MAE_18760 family HEPN-like nuclease [Stakelama sp. W311]
MSPIKEIERDLDWRETELATLRLLLANRAVQARERTVLFRAAWTLLYAHYEGFCKFALTVYYDTLKRSGKKCDEFPFPVQCFAVSKNLKKIRDLPRKELLQKIVKFSDEHLKSSPSFPEVETDSNLWPDKLIELLYDADLVTPSLPLHNRKLETLVRRRNKIAHGERDIIKELDYYVEYEDAFKIVAYELVFAINDKLEAL